jgi:hypothetical protein
VEKRVHWVVELGIEMLRVCKDVEVGDEEWVGEGERSGRCDSGRVVEGCRRVVVRRRVRKVGARTGIVGIFGLDGRDWNVTGRRDV